MAGLKVSILGPKLAEMVFFPLKFLAARMNTPQDVINLGTYRVVWQFCKNRSKDIHKFVS